MIRPLLVAVLSFALLYECVAQDRCTSQLITERWLMEHGQSSDLLRALTKLPKGVSKGGGTPSIPVAVHVVWNIAAENVASSTIQDMIAMMNADFQFLNSDLGNVRPAFTSDAANPDMSFCLASIDPNGNATTGITRTQTTDDWFDPSTETDDMKSAPKGIAPWDPTSYLNIWICDIASGLGGGLITTGYTYLPFGGVVGSDVDGIVIDFDYGIGPGTRTATHEIGHYFGLLHPWADGGCGSDDGMADTPTTDTPTFSCFPTDQLKCGNLVQYENFMDYSDCGLMFTNDQAAQMNAILFGDRASLLASDGCTGVNPGGPCVPTSSVGTSLDDYIDGVQLGSISNTSSGSITGPSYTDYTSLISTDLVRGSNYDVIITSGQYTPDNYAVWIDYDQSETFSSTEKLGEWANTAVGESHMFNFTVPASATLGTTIMRVRGVYHDVGEPTPTDPCYSYTYGETEDYGVVIQTSTGLTNLDPGTLTITSMPDAVIITWPGDMATTHVRLLDVSGRMITTVRSNDGHARFPFTDLTPGVYVVQVEARGHRLVASFAVAR